VQADRGVPVVTSLRGGATSSGSGNPKRKKERKDKKERKRDKRERRDDKRRRSEEP
jgi:hypothetical protein